jgi:hypothetical protein
VGQDTGDWYPSSSISNAIPGAIRDWKSASLSLESASSLVVHVLLVLLISIFMTVIKYKTKYSC